MRLSCLTLAFLLVVPARAWAEWQIKPFLGVAFGGETTFIDLERAAGGPNAVVGVNGVLLGEVIGIEADVAYVPSFFQSGDQHLVAGSSATTVTGNFVIAMPRRLVQYSLRPYVVGGLGLMHTRINPGLGVLQVSSTLPAVDVGGGATGFLTNRIGINWDVRRFGSFGGAVEGRGLSFGAEQLSFWRANMAVAIRY